MAKKKLGLVLSGGGVRAIAHAGFIQALLENNIQPDGLAGTSGGALVSVLYATGYQPEDMLAFFKQTPVFRFSLFAMNKPGLMDSEKYDVLFRKFFTIDNFEDLLYPTTITATNITSGLLEYFNEGNVIKPLMASCAIPPYFSPVEINNQLYSDGGILNNFPTEPLRNKYEHIIGSFVNPVTHIEKKDVNNTFKLLQRVYHISFDAHYYRKFKKCDYVFIPADIHKIGALDQKMIDAAFKIGYDNAKVEIPKIKDVLGM